jgi:hypothetical protein
MPALGARMRVPATGPRMEDLESMLLDCGMETSVEVLDAREETWAANLRTPLSAFDIEIGILDGVLHVECVVPAFCGTMYHYWRLLFCLRNWGFRDSIGPSPRIPDWAESTWDALPKWRKVLQR